MTAPTSAQLEKIEFYSIFLNNIFLVLGISIFGWTLFDTLFLYWLEPIAAALLLLYIKIVVPLKYGHPGVRHTKEFKQKGLLACLYFIWVLIASYFALKFIIWQSGIPDWTVDNGIFSLLGQLPHQLWKHDLLFLSILFLAVYLLPALLLEKRGIIPLEDKLPMQAQIMLHRLQFFSNFAWYLILWVCAQYVSTNPVFLITVLALFKSVTEGLLFSRIKSKETISF